MRRATAGVLGALVLAFAVAHAGPASATTPLPGAGARAATVIEAGSGDQLYGRDANGREAIASATKLMTALVTLEHVHRLGVMLTQNGYRSAADDDPTRPVRPREVLRRQARRHSVEHLPEDRCFDRDAPSPEPQAAGRPQQLADRAAAEVATVRSR